MRPESNPTTPAYPASLTTQDQWLLMTLTWNDERQKFSKTPIDAATRQPANSDAHGRPFNIALTSVEPDSVLAFRNPDTATRKLGLIDCDDCVAPDGTISPRICNLLRYMNAYAEFSVSGSGVHVLCWLDDVPEQGHKDREWDIEFYWEKNTIPLTGRRVELSDWSSPDDISDATKRYLIFHAARFLKKQSLCVPTPVLPCALTQEHILKLLFSERKGTQWQDIYSGHWQHYYESASQADFALLLKLAFYTGKDSRMMEDIFSASPLANLLVRGNSTIKRRQPKWSNRNYRERSIATAIQHTTAAYNPTPRKRTQPDQELYQMRKGHIHAERKHKQ